MSATIDDYEMATVTKEMTLEVKAGPATELARADQGAEKHFLYGRLPWIGALPNPRIGPMVVINDAGYLVPLGSAGDLLRGCRYFWREYQDQL